MKEEATWVVKDEKADEVRIDSSILVVCIDNPNGLGQKVPSWDDSWRMEPSWKTSEGCSSS
jgi:hypothetical protein